MIKNAENYSAITDGSESIHSVVEKFLPSEHAKVLGKDSLKLMSKELNDDYYKEKHHSPEEVAQDLADQVRTELESFNDFDDEFNKRESRAAIEHSRLMQNTIFTYFAREGNSEHGKSIIDLIHPEPKIASFSDKNQTQYDDHAEEYLRPRVYLDFISALTEKNDFGQYKVSNRDLNTFTNWYHSEVKRLETEVEKNAPDFERYYTNALGFAIRQKFLPESFQSCLDYFNPDSPKKRPIKYTLMDRTKRVENGTSPSGFANFDEKSDSFIVGLAIDRIYSYSTHKSNEVKDGFRVVNHELTHVISDTESFKFYDEYDKEYSKAATIILVESITEDIGGIISAVAETENEQDSSAKPPKIEPIGGNGQSYVSNRQTLQFLQQGGAHEISQNLFYEAYIDASKWPDLNSELKAAFPECKTDRELADFIVKKRNEFKK